MTEPFLESLYFSLFSGVIGAFLFYQAYKKRYFTLAPTSQVQISTLDLFFGYAIRFFSFQLITVLLHFQGASFFHSMFPFVQDDGTFIFFVNFLPMSLNLLLYGFYFGYFKPELLTRIWKRSSSTLWEDIKVGLTGFIIAYPISLFVNGISKSFLLLFFPENYLPDQNVVQELKRLLEITPVKTLFLMGINTVILAPLLEEFLFRGLLQNWLRRWLERGIAIFVTSIIFAFFHYHYSQYLGNIPIVLSTFILSGFLGICYEKKGSLFSSIVLHAAFNFSSIFLLFLYYLNTN